MIEKRLELYFLEVKKYIELIEDAKEIITLPISNYDNLQNIEKFAINVHMTEYPDTSAVSVRTV
jgi:hypothetical protein